MKVEVVYQKVLGDWQIVIRNCPLKHLQEAKSKVEEKDLEIPENPSQPVILEEIEVGGSDE